MKFKEEYYLYKEVEPYDEPHLDFGVDFIVEVVIDNLIHILHGPSSNNVHQWDDVSISGSKDEIRREVEDSHTADEEWQPLVMEKIPENS